MRTRQRRTAGVALTAPVGLALQRGGERARDVGAPGAGRTGEQPRMRHVVLDRALQRLYDRPLADEICPDSLGRHTVSWLFAARTRCGSRRSRTAAAISSRSPWASTTR